MKSAACTLSPESASGERRGELPAEDDGAPPARRTVKTAGGGFDATSATLGARRIADLVHLDRGGGGRGEGRRGEQPENDGSHNGYVSQCPARRRGRSETCLRS